MNSKHWKFVSIPPAKKNVEFLINIVFLSEDHAAISCHPFLHATMHKQIWKKIDYEVVEEDIVFSRRYRAPSFPTQISFFSLQHHWKHEKPISHCCKRLFRQYLFILNLPRSNIPANLPAKLARVDAFHHFPEIHAWKIEVYWVFWSKKTQNLTAALHGGVVWWADLCKTLGSTTCFRH